MKDLRNFRREQRLTIGIVWLFLVHALLNVAVGLYRCHNVVPYLTDHLATVLPRAQTCLLVIWVVLGSSSILKRAWGFIAGHALIFVVYSNFLFPNFRSLRYEWRNSEWLTYFDYSAPGDWLVKLPILIVGVGVPLWLFQFRSRHERISSDDILIERPSYQFDLVDILLWTSAAGLLLILYSTPFYDGWTSKLFEKWNDAYRFQTISDVQSLASAVCCVALALLILVLSKIENLWQRIIIQVGLAVIASSILKWSIRTVENTGLFQRSWGGVANEAAFELTFVLVVSGSLIVMEVLGDPGFGATAGDQRSLLKEIKVPTEMAGSGDNQGPTIDAPTIDI